MVATPSWPGSSGPSPHARAATDGPDEPGHDAEATGGPILTPMGTRPAMTVRTYSRPVPIYLRFAVICRTAQGRSRLPGEIGRRSMRLDTDMVLANHHATLHFWSWCALGELRCAAQAISNPA